MSLALDYDYRDAIAPVREDHLDARELVSASIIQAFNELGYIDRCVERYVARGDLRKRMRCDNDYVRFQGIESATRIVEAGCDFFEPGGGFFDYEALLELSPGEFQAISERYIKQAEGLLDRLRGMA